VLHNCDGVIPSLISLMNLVIRPRTIAWVLLLIGLLLSCAHVLFVILRVFFDHNRVLGLAKLFDFNNEMTVPSLFSTVLLQIVALLLGVLAVESWRSSHGWQFHWFGLSLVFLFLSVDEMLALHERLMFPVRSIFNATGIFYAAWFIPYLIALSIIAAFYIRFFLKLHASTRWRFVLAAVLFFTGAVFLEALSGVEWEQTRTRTLLQDMYIFFEDVFEVAGSIVFIWALLHELSRREVSISIERDKSSHK
jgi:hypothetical protein